MFEALRHGFRRLQGKQALAPPATPPATTSDQTSASAIVAALDAFLEKEKSYDRRGDVFAALIRRFAAHNPVESQVKAMFDEVLHYIVAPMHRSLFWGDRLLTLDKAAGFFEDENFRSSYEA